MNNLLKNIVYNLLLIIIFGYFALGQSLETRYSKYGKIIIEQLRSAPFPHPKRANGLNYKDKIYPVEKHYSDSSVLFFIPNNFKVTNKVDLVVYLHGWYNNIDSACIQFNLIEQFYNANKNAIFIFPEGPKDAPDSFGGKLEDPDGFRIFVEECFNILKNNNIIRNKDVGNIIIGGHSGAYHGISFILMQGNLNKNIKEVYLFDALYGQTEKFVHWFDKYKGKLINIFTENGGTKYESESLMDDLKGWNLPYYFTNEVDINAKSLNNNKLVFIYSKLGHNEILSKANNLELFLKHSVLKNIKN